MSAVPLQVAPQQEIEMDLGAVVTIDSLQSENEFSMPIRARFYCENHGDVRVTSVWVHGLHDNSWAGLPFWKSFHFPRAIVRSIEHAIEDGLRKAEEKDR